MNHEVTIFEQVLAISSPEEREAYLREACAGDAAMLERLHGLLRAHDLSGRFLEHSGPEPVPSDPAPASTSDPPASPVAARPPPLDPQGVGPIAPEPAAKPEINEPGIPYKLGRYKILQQIGEGGPVPPEPAIETANVELGIPFKIGRYKILQQIGEGGCGVVYMAEQEEPVRRRVALKIIKPGMDSRHVIVRFEAERQALALMDHPNIAKILDAGTVGPLDSQLSAIHHQLSPGLPFFVMDLVQGLPIIQFCDEAKLPTRERLALFLEVCSAIQHAHQKGVIHRDIKPSNILVTLEPDGSGLPKIIDFGIAKATQQPLTDKTLFTQFQQLIGTPAYMSPEQATLTGFDIDTRSDIYSLGVLLYELLTGKTPFDSTELLKVGLDELRRTIRETEPARPSNRVSTLPGEELTTTAKRRGVDAAKLVSVLRGDLDWIVMKCLEKDRARRYETANGLAMDIQRHLNNEPIVARSPSASYRFQKFVRRNKLMVTAAGAVVAVLVLGICASTWEAVRARRAEQIGRRLGYAGKMNMAQMAWEQNRVAQVRQLLEDTATYPDRGFEWYYWQRQTHLELMTLRHLDEVHAVDFSPDGRRMVTVSQDTTAKVWDAASGKELFTLQGHVDLVSEADWSPDGQRIATASDDATVKIWNASDGKPLFTFTNHTGRVESVRFSQDSQWVVSSSDDGTAKLWEAATGKERLSLRAQVGRMTAAALSPNGRRIVTSSDDQTVRVWDALTGETPLTLPGHSDDCVAFSPDGLRIASGGDQLDPSVKVWDAASGKLLVTLAGHEGTINSVRFSPDSQRIVTSSDDRTVKVWEAATGKELFTIKGHSDAVNDATFSPDGQRVATASNDHTVKVWDATGSREVISLAGHSNGVHFVEFSRDGRRILTRGGDSTVIVRDAASGAEVVRLPGENIGVASATFSPDGRQIATGDNQSAKVWDAASGHLLFPLEGHNGAVTRLAFSPDSHQILTGGLDRTAQLWDAVSRKRLHAFRGHAEGISGVAFAPDGKRIVTASGDGIAIVWNLAWKTVATLRGHSAGISSITFSPDGLKILTASRDHTARVWDAFTGRELLPLRGHTHEVRSAAFSPDGQRILTTSADQTAKLWDPVTGAELLTLKGPHAWFQCGVFSPDGRRILTGGNDSIARLWDAATTNEMAAWTEQARNVEAQQVALANEQAAGDQQAHAFSARDPGAIRQWLVLGPLFFEGYLGAKALADQQIANEAQLHPSARRPQQVAGTVWAWRDVQTDDYRLDTLRLFGLRGPHILAYLVTYIVSDTDQTNLLIKVGSAGQSKVYLNGDEVYRHDKPRKFVADQDVLGVVLKQGVNVVVFKVVNEGPLWRASLRFTDAAGQPVKGIRVALEPQ
jgi:WD40 repeat protein/serine/threonine protein kinase